MPQAGTIDQQLLMNQAEEQQAAARLREIKNAGNSAGRSADAIKDEELRSRWREVKQKAKEKKLNAEGLSKKNRKLGKNAAKKIKTKLAQGSSNVFYVLLFIALVVDLLEYMDLGAFSSIANVGIYIIVIVGGFIMYFFKSSNKKSIFNILKGQLWKYTILPLMEMVPLVNLLPFWTGTVFMMWMKFKRERKKLIAQEKKEERKLQAAYV